MSPILGIVFPATQRFPSILSGKVIEWPSRDKLAGQAPPIIMEPELDCFKVTYFT